MSKAQFAVEHLMVIGIGILLIIPVISLLFSYSTTQTDELIENQVFNIGSKIIDTSETIYYMGSPSKITLEENFPEKIVDIKVLGNKELVFYVGSDNVSIPFVSKIPIDGVFYGDVSKYCNDSTLNNECYSAGMKKITIMAGDDNASIIFK